MTSLNHKHNTVKVRIPIQSVSDLITNSSSEVFCRISSEDHLSGIWNLLKPLFNNYDPEMYPYITERNLEEEKDQLDVEEIKRLPYRWIEISLPYDMDESKDFYRAGLDAILSKNFEDYTIDYEDD